MLLTQALGLLVGAIFWGVGCDVWGCWWPFNLTVLVTAIFSLIAAAAPNYIVLCACAGGWSFGMGGNLPVDSAVFLEFVPPSHQYLLTVLCVFWLLGDLVGSLVSFPNINALNLLNVAWPLINNFSCPPALAQCPASLNRGWRDHLLATGDAITVMWMLQFFLFSRKVQDT
ncbi:hypothetical protein J3A83DRAFT_4484702 [Scleroderma citrinum]